MATIFPKDSGTSLNWAMKIAATASYKAVPSMFIVAPMGITNLDTLGSNPILSQHPIVRGIVAEL